jgi:hypothetical protein
MIANKCIYRDRYRLLLYLPEEEEGPGSGLALLMTLSWSRFEFLRGGGQETAVAPTVAPTAPEVDISNGNDIEAKRNEASILRHFLYRSETNKLILKL